MYPHQEVDHDGLHLGLSRLEVVSTDVDLVLLRQLHHAGYERVLRGEKTRNKRTKYYIMRGKKT